MYLRCPASAKRRKPPREYGVRMQKEGLSVTICDLKALVNSVFAVPLWQGRYDFMTVGRFPIEFKHSADRPMGHFVP